MGPRVPIVVGVFAVYVVFVLAFFLKMMSAMAFGSLVLDSEGR